MQWKCLKCGSKVSVWASVCPYCHRAPGGLGEHIVSFVMKIALVAGIIGTICMALFGGGS